MEANLLLESYLKQLRLPGFLGNYRKFAEDAAQTNLSFDRYLLSLAEQEIAQRERNRQVRLIKAARFPVLKELEPIRKLSCRTGCWHRRTERRPTSWWISCTNVCARCVVSLTSPKYVRPPSAALGTGFRRAPDTDRGLAGRVFVCA